MQRLLPRHKRISSRGKVGAFLRWKFRTFSQFRIHALVAMLLDAGLRIEETLEFRKVLYRWLAKNEFSLLFPTLMAHFSPRARLKIGAVASFRFAFLTPLPI